jgi:hypothetical protein
VVKLFVSWRFRSGSYPRHGVKREHWIEAPIESENVFVQVCLNVFFADTMVRADKPCFQISENAMNVWKDLAGIFRIFQYERFVDKTVDLDAIVSRQTVCAHNRARLDILIQKAGQMFKAEGGYQRNPNAP